MKSLGSLHPAARVAPVGGAHSTDGRCLVSARTKGVRWPALLGGPFRRLSEARSPGAATVKKDAARSLPMEVESNAPIVDSDLEQFISQGPLLGKLGTSGRHVADSIEEWRALGAQLSRHLGFDEFKLSESERKRIFHYYVPVFLWCKEQLALHRSRWQDDGPPPPLVVRLCRVLSYLLHYHTSAIVIRGIDLSLSVTLLPKQGRTPCILFMRLSCSTRNVTTCE